MTLSMTIPLAILMVFGFTYFTMLAIGCISSLGMKARFQWIMSILAVVGSSELSISINQQFGGDHLIRFIPVCIWLGMSIAHFVRGVYLETCGTVHVQTG